MKVKDCMCTEVCCVKPETTVHDVAKLMCQNHIGSIPVCDTNNCLCGIVTDRDIILRSIACDKDVKTTISTYNSVDKSYFEKATNVLNEQFKELDNKKIVENIKDDDIDKIIEMLQERKQQELQEQEYEREQKKKKKEKDFEM